MKKLLSVVLCIALLSSVITMLPVTVGAETISGACGDDLTWTLDDEGTLTISGTGDMYDFDWEYTPWYEYCSDIYAVMICDGVTSIGECAFSDLDMLTSVTIPDSVTSIGSNAFYGCCELTDISIPDSVTSIGEDAFFECSMLEFNVFDNAKYLGNDDNPYMALIEYTNIKIKSCKINENTKIICESAFFRCTLLTSITIPGSVTSIGYSAFNGCTGLEKVTIGHGVTSIGNRAFFKCSSLTEVFYMGLEDEWSEISIGSNNSPLLSATLHFNTDYYNLCDDNLRWFIDTKGTLRITGSGAMKNYTDTYSGGARHSTAPWCDYYSSIKTIKITSGVTSIGNYAFYGCSSMTDIYIPDSVTSIGRYAFSGCSSLESIEIPYGVTSIEYGAFSGCLGIEIITVDSENTVFHSDGNCLIETASGTLILGCKNSVIPSDGSVTSIGNGAFNGCSSLESIEIPYGVTSIGYEAFESCSSLTNIDIPDSVTSIGSHAFSGCALLESIEIPYGVTSIGYETFWGCSSLTNIDIPGSVTSIGDFAFYGCSSLSDVYYGGTVEMWNEINLLDDLIGFYDCNLTIHCCDSVVIHTGKIGSDLSWSYDTESGVLTVCGTRKEIDDYSNPWDDYRSEIETVNIAGGITSIDGAFKNYSSLKSIIISDSVTAIRDGAFSNCSNLESITVASGNPTYHSDGNCLIETASGTLILGCKNSVIPSDGSVTSIGNSAFYFCSSLSSVFIPKSVISIGRYVFQGCSGLSSITVDSENTVFHSDGNCLIETASGKLILGCKNSVIPSDGSVTSIGGGAFSGCSSLTSIDIPGSVTLIDSYAFSGCALLESIEIPYGMTSIGEYAFYGCSSLTSIDIPDSVTSIGDSAFDGCTSLTSINIPDSVTAIRSYAFSGCTSLTSIDLPASLASIGSGTFNGCSSLPIIYIPGSVTSIEGYAFNGCSSLTYVNYQGDESGWKRINIKGNNLPLQQAEMHFNTFDHGTCGDNLYWALDKDGNLAVFGTGEMYDYNNDNNTAPWSEYRSVVASIEIGDGVSSIGDHAFYGCSLMTKINISDSVTSIGYEAFFGWTSLEEINVGKGNEVYHSDGNCLIETASGTLILGCKNSVIPSDGSLTSIGDSAFFGISSLTSVIIPGGVTSIGDRAFCGCSSLTEIMIPESVTSIGTGAFSDCSLLTDVYYQGDESEWESIEINSGNSRLQNSSIHFNHFISGSCGESLKWALDKYGHLTISGTGDMPDFGWDYSDDYGDITSAPWGQYAPLIERVEISDGVTSIGEAAFLGCRSLESVSISGSLTSLGDYAFDYCDSLVSVSISGSVASVGNYAFHYCDSLMSVEFPNGLTSIGISAFYGCSSLADVTIPDGVTSIGEYAFEYCNSLNYNVYGNAKYLGNPDEPYLALIKYTTRKDITSCEIHEGTKIIADEAFYNAYRLMIVVIPEGVEIIGKRAFICSGDLKSLYLPASLKSIGEAVVYDCRSFEKVFYNGSESDWENIVIEDNNEDLLAANIYYSGEDNVESGVCGDNLTWTFSERSGKLTISGKGDMYDYDWGDAPWHYLASYVRSVEIENGVKSIGNNVFLDLQSATSVIVPDSVTRIGDYAFSHCYSLRSITIPGSVTSIGYSAFYFCSSLSSVFIPKSVISIGRYVFQGCSGLSSITVDEKNHAYRSSGNCLIDMSSYMLLAGCNNSVIPSDGSVRVIGDYAFSHRDGLESIEIPEGVTWIGDYAFELCDSLTSIEIPGSVTSIGAYAFYGCDSLESVSIPESVMSIGAYAFYSCDSLESVYIPSGLISIGQGAFRGCSGLSSITVDAENPVYHSSGNCLIETESKTLLVGCKNSVIPSDGSVTSIGDAAFSDCRSLTSVDIPKGVTEIGNYAFSYCSLLESINIPDGVTSIGDYAFYECDSLESVSIPESVMSIGDYAFSCCYSLTSVDIHDGVTSIGDSAFSYCSALSSISLPESLTSVGRNVFYGCDSISYNSYGGALYFGVGENPYYLLVRVLDKGAASYEINSNTKVICGAAFENCYSLESINIPEGVKSIGNSAFYECSSLTSVAIPEGVTSIGNKAFEYCSSLESVELPDSLTLIGKNVFEGCDLLEYNYYDNAMYFGNAENPYLILMKYTSQDISSCEINENTRFIAGSAFYNAYMLVSITIPDGVKSIGEDAFEYSFGLRKVSIPSSVEMISDGAFRDCNSLSKVFYAGSEEEFENIKIGKDNGRLRGAKFFYNSEEESYSGVCGDNLTWSLSERTGMLEISGTGDMYDYDWQNPSPWEEYASMITSLKIGPGVTSIGDQSFNSYNYRITAIYIEDLDSWFGLKMGTKFTGGMGGLAPLEYHGYSKSPGLFIACKYDLYLNGEKVTDLVVPEGVEEINPYLFDNCSSIESVTLSSTVKKIGECAFCVCNNLKTVSFNEGLEEIGSAAFCGSGLTSVTLPSTVRIVDRAAFDSCTSLASIELDDALESVGYGAFYGAPATSIAIPDSLENIDNFAFYLPSLVEFTTKDSCENYTAVDGVLYSKDMTKLVQYPAGKAGTSYTVPSGVTSIGALAFANNRSIENVELPDGVTSIWDGAFEYCSSLESVNIPDGVSTVGNSAFAYCSALREIFIPGSVTKIDYFAFYQCSALTTASGFDGVELINIAAFSGCSSLEYNVSDNARYLGNPSNPYVILMSGTEDDITSVEIKEGTRIIDRGAFYNYSSLETVTIPSSVKIISSDAFNGCSSLTDVYFDGNIADWMKIDVDGYSNVSLKNAALHINGSTTASGECGEGLTWELDVLAGTLTITGAGDMDNFIWDNSIPWSNCTLFIKSVVISDGVTSIGEYAFNGCEALTSIEIPKSLTSIGMSAFYSCSSLTDVYYTGSEEEWNNIAIDNSYDENDSLLNATMHYNYVPEPQNVASGTCGDNLTWTLDGEGMLTISGTGDMYDFTLSEGVSMAPWAEYLSLINNVVISSGATSIGEYAFFKHSAIISATVPEGVTTIGEGAFYGCSSMTTVSVPDSLTSIGYSAFRACTSLIYNISGNAKYLGNSENPYVCLMGVVDSSETALEVNANTKIISSMAFIFYEALESVTIPASVCAIETEAFSECNSLADVYYAGSEEEWNEIRIENGNDPILGATKHFAGSPEPPAGHSKVVCDGLVLGEYEVGAVVILPTMALISEAEDEAYRFFTWSGADVIRGEYDKNSDSPNGRTYTMIMPEGEVELTAVYSYVGDVNGDNKITTKDLSEIKKLIAGSIDSDDAKDDRADIDGNGKNTTSDIKAIKKLIAGGYTITR